MLLFQSKERLVPDNESILNTLLEWGSDLEDVKFYLRPKEEAPSFTQALNSKIIKFSVFTYSVVSLLDTGCVS